MRLRAQMFCVWFPVPNFIIHRGYFFADQMASPARETLGLLEDSPQRVSAIRTDGLIKVDCSQDLRSKLHLFNFLLKPDGNFELVIFLIVRHWSLDTTVLTSVKYSFTQSESLCCWVFIRN